MNTLIRTDSFADRNLALDCIGWSEFGPAMISSLPELGGVQFGAKLFAIDA